jgi:hypothetical protein
MLDRGCKNIARLVEIAAGIEQTVKPPAILSSTSRPCRNSTGPPAADCRSLPRTRYAQKDMHLQYYANLEISVMAEGKAAANRFR